MLLCLWLFRIRSWNAFFFCFLIVWLQNDGRFLTPYNCACSTFIFKQSFPLLRNHTLNDTITPYGILNPPSSKNTPRVLTGWNLSHHKTHPPYMGIPAHWRLGGGGAINTCATLIHTNQCRIYEVTTATLSMIYQLTKASTAALTSVYRHVTHKHTSVPFTRCHNNADIVLLCICIRGSARLLELSAPIYRLCRMSPHKCSWPAEVHLI